MKKYNEDVIKSICPTKKEIDNFIEKVKRDLEEAIQKKDKPKEKRLKDFLDFIKYVRAKE